MRTIFAFGIVAILLVAAIGYGAKNTPTTTGQGGPARASLMDPFGMMKNAKDLPVHDIKEPF